MAVVALDAGELKTRLGVCKERLAALRGFL